MDVAAYLDRLGLDRPATADVAALRTLQERHLAVVPFENLSIHLGEPIVLDSEALFDKIVRRRRGGFCYELNGLFAALLRELGFDVALSSAKVFRPDGTLGPPFDHAVVHVDLDEPWLADVGFGRFSRFPLRLTATEAQADPEGEFLILDAPHGDIDVLRDGEPQYRIERRPRALDEFVPTAFWQSTSPDSHFTRGPTCSLPSGHGRVTLAGDKLIVTTHGVREETRLSSDPEILDTYRKEFGIELARAPGRP
ncbi:arylamine N-acetyltransferase family protein [Amycolatopsis decaplanina]|uniref:N-hydroxyarylamine O-acetyltransferase n=1 Tax=Amycolatopsis decaplanina DSM 44594 TaxID=1284240 RepID=M2Z1P6_9PSEU|nr:arylamine N-acetyltransferase [Amycolatopsis decaplanina]EME54534.1 N-hydroxyarylamine O-acetyltransferase [Amycolatopsis decaplanina DSM 44594]